MLTVAEHNTRTEDTERMDVEASRDTATIVDNSEHGPLLPTKVGTKGAARTAVIHLTASPATHGAAQRVPQQLPRDSLKSVVAVVVWYGSNIGLLCLNRYLLSSYGFRQPVFLTFWHMVCCCLCASACTATPWVEAQSIRSWAHLGKIALLAGVFTFSVVGGNISLKFVPVSFNQAVGATTPAFTVLLGWLAYGHTETHRVCCALIPVVLGIVITSGFEPSFHIIGLLFLLSSTAARAYKSLLQGKLLEESADKLNSINLLKHMTPIAAVTLLLLVMVIEPNVRDAIPTRESPDFVPFCVLLLLNGLLSFAVNLSNFLVTHYTSPLTLQVLGNVKGFVGAAVSIAIFRNGWTWSGLGGYLVAIAGLFWYMRERRAAAAARDSVPRRL